MRLLPDHSSTRTRLAGLAVLVLLVGPVSACGGDDADDADADAASASAESSVAPGSEPTADPSAEAGTPTDPGGSGSGTGGSGSTADGTLGGNAAADPNSPFVVAATAVAIRSRDQITQLHAMGLATTGQGGLSADQLPALGEAIRAELGRQIDDSTMLPPPAGSPAADLVAALEKYRGLAGQLAAWGPGGAALPDAWFSRLATNDRAWKGALRQLGELSEQDLLADLAPLAMPS
ncbi:hypothetical protein [Nocardioides sp. W7]|uniref:hypothetical protein n=1 Tax=Nocardioides sp. W7 TaxID=2931390 RepID=UPI001FD624B1|nr:hypothetical protein [Nocardioides sp. W7]